MKILFWLSFTFISHTYVGYPLLLALLARFLRRPVSQGARTPEVSVVIAACNEERIISKRLENLLAQEYPSELYEIIVVSDGSTDLTNKIVASYSNRNVLLVQLNERVGKAEALNQGIVRAAGEIIVFADARQTFASDALHRLVVNFADPMIGCVSGELMFLDDAESGIRAEMGAYWQYEKKIRKLESASGSVVGATGAIYAIRKELYRPLPAGTILDDVLTPMNIALQGYRVLFDGTVRAFDVMSKNIDQEWMRKVRTLTGNWQLMSLNSALIIPFRNPIWYRFMSHKISRLFVPFLLPITLFTSFAVEGTIYRLLAVIQIVFYLLAVIGSVFPSTRKYGILKFAFFFSALNLAAAVGFWKWLTGQAATTWIPGLKGEES